MNPDLVKGPWTKEEDQKVTIGTRWAFTHPSESRDGEAVWGLARVSASPLRAVVR